MADPSLITADLLLDDSTTFLEEEEEDVDQGDQSLLHSSSRYIVSPPISEPHLVVDSIVFVFKYGILSICAIDLWIYTAVYCLAMACVVGGSLYEIVVTFQSGQILSQKSIGSQYSSSSAFSRHSFASLVSVRSSFSILSYASHASFASAFSAGGILSVGALGGFLQGCGEMVFYAGMFFFMDSLGRMVIQVEDKWLHLVNHPTRQKVHGLLQWVSCGVGRRLGDDSQNCMLDFVVHRAILFLHLLVFVVIGTVAAAIPVCGLLLGSLLKGFQTASLCAIIYYWKKEKTLCSPACREMLFSIRFFRFACGAALLSMVPLLCVWSPWFVMVAFIRMARNDFVRSLQTPMRDATEV